MIADIASGNTGAADVAYLVALILAVLATALAWPNLSTRAAGWTTPLATAALAAIALGLLLR